MRTCAELDVLPAKRCNLAIPEARLNGDEHQRLIPPSDPCARMRSRYNGGVTARHGEDGIARRRWHRKAAGSLILVFESPPLSHSFINQGSTRLEFPIDTRPRCSRNLAAAPA